MISMRWFHKFVIHIQSVESSTPISIGHAHFLGVIVGLCVGMVISCIKLN